MNSMHTESDEKLLVAAIEHDQTRIWHLHQHGDEPLVVVPRPESDIRHVRSAQERHGHQSESAEIAYFTAIKRELENSTHVIVLGHGRGRSNAMNLFVDFLNTQKSGLRTKLIRGDAMDFSSLSNEQILSIAKKLWNGQ